MLFTQRKIFTHAIIFLSAFCGSLISHRIVQWWQSPAHIEEAIAKVFGINDYPDVHGYVVFTQMADGVRVQAEINGLTPGEHGFHIHCYGDTYAHDLSSVCAHYNPTNQPHAGRDAEHRHVGDMGNLIADDDGIARVDYVDKHLTLNGKYSIIGRSVIIHTDPDDLVTQPTGNAGLKMAVGVIGIKSPATKITFGS